MANILELFGVKEKPKFDFFNSLFYFIKEFKINPLPEEYEIIPVYSGEKIVKLKIKKFALDMDIYNKLMDEMNKHYEKEKREYEKSSRKK